MDEFMTLNAIVKQKKMACWVILTGLCFFCGLVRAAEHYEAVGSGNSSTSNKYNIVLIVLDSVRADHLGCYGYSRKISPAIDGLAKKGIVFDNAICQSTWSLPSQCSIFTSKYVSSHGVKDTYTKLSDSELTLAEILKLYGYKTAAFTGGFWLSSVFNSGQGFDLYSDNLTFGKMNETVPLALDWLREHKDKRFFLFLQGFDGHSPFNLPEKYKDRYVDPSYNGIFKSLTIDHNIGDRLEEGNFFLDYNYKNKVKVTSGDINYLIDNYDGSITYADESIGNLLRKIDEMGLKNNTIIILTSYHGTPLYEHGIILRRFHGGVTEGSIRVPLLIRHPQFGSVPKRISSQVQLIDILPTILDFTGVPVNHQAQGKSLVSLIEGKEHPENEYAFVNGYKEVAVRTNGWKLIRLRESLEESFELFNLKNDPGENKNIIRRNKNVGDHLKKELSKWEEFTAKNKMGISQVPKQETDKIRKQMEDAGYWFVHENSINEVKGRDLLEKKKRHRKLARPVKIGYFHGGRSHGLYRAYVYDYFDNENVSVELYSQYLNEDEFLPVPKQYQDMKRNCKKEFGRVTGLRIIKAIKKGILDGGTPGESSFVEAVNKGSPLVAVAMLGQDVKDKPGKAFLLHKDIVINSPNDFKGKKFGTRRAGPGDRIFLSEYFKSIGLDPDKDLTIIDQIADNELGQMIKEKKIEGALYHLHSAIPRIESGQVYLYRPMDWLNPEISHALLVFRRDFVKEYPEEVMRVVRGYMKRIKYEYYLPEEKRLEVKDVGLQMSLHYKGMSLPQYNYPPLVNVDLLSQMQDLLFKYKIIESKIDLSRFVDNSFVEKIYEELK